MNVINFNLDNEKIKEEFKKNRKVVIKNFLDINFAKKLYNFIVKLPNKFWFYNCGIRNTRYTGRDTPNNLKKNNDNVKEAKKSFSKNEFSFYFLRTMEKRKKEISKFEVILRNTLNSKLFLSMISYFTDIKITQLNQLFLSKYWKGCFLAPHSDIGNGRIAYVLNLSVNWKPQYGGILHFLNKDRTKITESFVPEFNSLILFEVPEEGIPHFVSHIASDCKKKRYAITGWLS